MVDLFIDHDALLRTRHTLENVRETLTAAGQAMSSGGGSVTGNGHLRLRLEDFGTQWRHGIAKLAESSETGAQALGTISDTFAQVDAELGAAFDEGGPQPPAGPQAI